jgi:hypothetical protein
MVAYSLPLVAEATALGAPGEIRVMSGREPKRDDLIKTSTVEKVSYLFYRCRLITTLFLSMMISRAHNNLVAGFRQHHHVVGRHRQLLISPGTYLGEGS